MQPAKSIMLMHLRRVGGHVLQAPKQGDPFEPKDVPFGPFGMSSDRDGDSAHLLLQSVQQAYESP
jgi:hypothetical protein